MKEKINRVCIVDSTYTLLLYFLISTEKEIDTTFYFVSDGIPDATRKKLKNIYYFDRKLFCPFGRRMLKKSICALSLRLFSRIRWPFLKDAEIYGHDHLFVSPGLIGRRQLIFIEENPSEYVPPKHEHFLFLRRCLCGPLARYNRYGDHPFCKLMIITNRKVRGIERDKKETKLINVHDLWKNSSQEKRAKILFLFSLTSDDMNLLQRKDIILLTQWFSEEEVLTETEKLDMYKMIIEDIDKNKLVLKPHPRESTDYTLFFPDIYVFAPKVPVQLLDICGVRFKMAYTISSSAVLSFPYEIEKKVLGYSIHPKLLKAYENGQFFEKPTIL
jgi:hypothetical protein